MKDIAAEAGVHQTTVSLALRNHPSLPPQTRERIQKLAEKMGYRPDPALSALIAYRQTTKQTPTDQVIAFVVNCAHEKEFNESHVHSQLLEGARARAAKLGFKVDLFWYVRDYKGGRALNHVLKSRGIQGVILAAFGNHDLGIEMEWEFYSVVKINILPQELAFDTILSNQMFAVRLAMSKLRDEGLRRIGLAVADHDEVHNRNMYSAGYLVGQRHLDEHDRVPPLLFQRKPTKELHAEVIEWGRKHKLEAILSNWNSFDRPAMHLTANDNQHCRFVPLDADERTRNYGGVYQNHPVIGERAIDMVVGQIKTFRRDQEESTSLNMVHPTWISLKPWTKDSLVAETQPTDSSA